MRNALFALLLLTPLVAAAQESVSPKQRAERFFTELQSGNIDAAHQALFAGAQGFGFRPEDQQVLADQTGAAMRALGPVLGHEVVHEEQLSPSLVRLVYLLKLEKHPTMWELYFYKPRDRWVLSQVEFADRFQYLDPKR